MVTRPARRAVAVGERRNSGRVVEFVVPCAHLAATDLLALDRAAERIGAPLRFDSFALRVLAVLLR